MIEIKINDVLNKDVLDEINKKELKAKVAFQLSRIMRELGKEYELFQTNREKLLDKYVDKKEDGTWDYDEQGNVHVSQDKINDFNKEFNELLNATVSLNVESISLDDLKDETFTVEQMNILSLFI